MGKTLDQRPRPCKAVTRRKDSCQAMQRKWTWLAQDHVLHTKIQKNRLDLDFFVGGVQYTRDKKWLFCLARSEKKISLVCSWRRRRRWPAAGCQGTHWNKVHLFQWPGHPDLWWYLLWEISQAVPRYSHIPVQFPDIWPAADSGVSFSRPWLCTKLMTVTLNSVSPGPDKQALHLALQQRSFLI